MYTLVDAEKYLAISKQTLKNWIRNKKITLNDDGLISIEQLETAKRVYLQTRANRSSNTYITQFAKKFLHNHTIADILFSRVSDIVAHFQNESLSRLLREYKKRWNCTYIPGTPDISTGDLYQKLLSVQRKSQKGIHYTPAKLRSLVERITKHISGKILDPCCGDGFFLTAIASNRKSFKDLYGFDCDPHAVFLARINLILTTAENQIPNIYETDYFTVSVLPVFSLIITNPPWGRLRIGSRYYEMFAEFVKKSLHITSEHLYLLPHAAANVDIHKPFRIKIEENFSTDIILHDIVFNGVQSRGFLLHLNSKNERQRMILPSRVWPLQNNDMAEAIILKIIQQDSVYLTDKSEWIMGVVTGNNNRFITQEKTENTVPVIRGRNIFPGFLLPAENEFLDISDISAFQQFKPLHTYSLPKIIYRFIANRPVCFYDTSGSVLLNSANSFIPEAFAYSPNEIIDVLNSDITAFFLHYLKRPLKILKSHLKMIPFPAHGKFKSNIGELYGLNKHEIHYIQEYIQLNKLERIRHG